MFKNICIPIYIVYVFRIDATRDMCNLVKAQVCDLEKTLGLCDTAKEDLVFQSEEQSSLYQV